MRGVPQGDSRRSSSVIRSESSGSSQLRGGARRDSVEEKHAEGESLIESLLDAGIVRLRPVLITVGATVLGLFPLASHGGPLWEGLCYEQIGLSLRQ